MLALEVIGQRRFNRHAQIRFGLRQHQFSCVQKVPSCWNALWHLDGLPLQPANEVAFVAAIQQIAKYRMASVG